MRRGWRSSRSIVVAEHIDSNLGVRLIVPLSVAGVLSVWYWQATERGGVGDLRPYLVVQYLPMVLVPVILLLFPAVGGNDRIWWGVLAGYALAKTFELFDRQLFELTGGVSGHPLKHVAAAAAIALLAVSLKRRSERYPNASSAPVSSR